MGVPMYRVLKAHAIRLPESADACCHPRDKHDTGMPYMVKVVTAVWHRQRSTSAILRDYPCSKGLVVR